MRGEFASSSPSPSPPPIEGGGKAFCKCVNFICALPVALLLGGCGLIYSDRIAPYSAKFGETPTGTKRCEINKHQIKEPVSGYNLYAEWSSGYILEEARKAGIREIYYMDKRTLSILLGVYKRESFIVYGD